MFSKQLFLNYLSGIVTAHSSLFGVQITKIRIASDFGCRREIRSGCFSSRLGELSPTLFHASASTKLPFSLSTLGFVAQHSQGLADAAASGHSCHLT